MRLKKRRPVRKSKLRKKTRKMIGWRSAALKNSRPILVSTRDSTLISSWLSKITSAKRTWAFYRTLLIRVRMTLSSKNHHSLEMNFRILKAYPQIKLINRHNNRLQNWASLLVVTINWFLNSHSCRNWKLNQIERSPKMSARSTITFLTWKV